jgi:hypothetical protein
MGAVAKLGEGAPVAGVERRTGLDFDGGDIAGAALENEVDFVPTIAIVVDADVHLSPLRVFDELHRDEVLQQPAGDLVVLGDPLLVGGEQVRE